MKTKINKIVGNTKYEIEIRLDDECKNGVDNFAMTASIKEKRRNGRWVYVGGGACHEEIVKVMPTLSNFGMLHLRNYIGQPMYAIENGLYWIKNGNKENVKVHFNLWDKEVEEMMQCTDALDVKYFIDKFGIAQRWKDLADRGILELEMLCGLVYQPQGTKIQDVVLTDDERKIVEERLNNDYYTDKAKDERTYEKYCDWIENEYRARTEIAERKIKELQHENDLYNYLCTFLKAHKEFMGYEKQILGNVIYYNHRKSLEFNWCNYNTIPQDIVEDLISKLSNKDFMTQYDVVEIKKSKNIM